MEVSKRRGNLQDDVVQRRPAVPVEVLRNLFPAEVLHREVRKATVQEAVLANLHDALVLERGKRRELSLEAEELLRFAELVAQDLDRFVLPARNVEHAVDARGRCFLENRAKVVPLGTLERRFDR